MDTAAKKQWMEIFFSSLYTLPQKKSNNSSNKNENDSWLDKWKWYHTSDMFVYLGFYIICNIILYIEYPYGYNIWFHNDDLKKLT